MDMFQFIWGFLIGIGVGFILGLLIAKVEHSFSLMYAVGR